jgi:hypothetical protein
VNTEPSTEAERPKCHLCGVYMELRDPPGGWTPEQRFCGIWYDHPPMRFGVPAGHAATILYPSKELITQNKELMA